MSNMLTSDLALFVLAGLALVLALVIPLLNAAPKLSNFISLRWTCVAIVLLIMVGVVVDFSHLSDTSRDIVLKGGVVIVGIFIIVRTVEKVLYNGWLKGVNLKGSIQKGDVKVDVDLSTKSAEKKDDKPKPEPNTLLQQPLTDNKEEKKEEDASTDECNAEAVCCSDNVCSSEECEKKD